MAWDGSLSASETVTASGNGASLAIGPTGVFEVEVETSGVSGTSPTLDLKFQESDDDVNYADILGLPQITGSFK
ncbi:MAG TPA: hypothetical protein VFK27_03660, partial [Bacillales bacterium]|nr:hypothetical protein [Bacillales bacterium]